MAAIFHETGKDRAYSCTTAYLQLKHRFCASTQNYKAAFNEAVPRAKIVASLRHRNKPGAVKAQNRR